MGQGELAKVAVAGLVGRGEDQRHVHHDVDEQRLRTEERAQVPPLGHEPLGQRAARLVDNHPHRRVAGQLVPRPIGVEKDEAQVVYAAVQLPRLQEPRVVFRPGQPSRVAGPPVESPHHPRQKAAGPVCPKRPFVEPFPGTRVNGKIVRVPLDEGGHLLLGELQGGNVSSGPRVGHARGWGLGQPFTGDCPNFRGAAGVPLGKGRFRREKGTVRFGQGDRRFFGRWAIADRHAKRAEK